MKYEELLFKSRHKPLLVGSSGIAHLVFDEDSIVGGLVLSGVRIGLAFIGHKSIERLILVLGILGGCIFSSDLVIILGSDNNECC